MAKFIKQFIALCMLGLMAQGALAAGKPMVTYTTKGTFDDVKDNILFAIGNRGMVINATSHISDMLERTGKDLGATKQVYIKAENLEFCSATVSRKMMEADPHNIVFCPYIISIYVLPQEPDKVYISYRKPEAVGTRQSREALKDVEKLLDGIIKEALE
jgi:uncharacterized protein (DUF302 family)